MLKKPLNNLGAVLTRTSTHNTGLRQMIKMIGSKVLVTEIEQKDNVTAAGIILQTDVTTGSKPGLVLATGPEVTHLSTGDHVYLKWSESMPVDVDGNKAAIVDMDYIVAVLD